MKRGFLFTIGLVLTAAYLFPLYWMYVTAFKGSAEIFQVPPTFWPNAPEWNVGRVFATTNIGVYVWNSLLVALGATATLVGVRTACA